MKYLCVSLIVHSLCKTYREYPQVYGDFQMLLPEHDSVFAYTRSLDGVTALVALNFSTNDISVDLGLTDLSAKRVVLSNYDEGTATTSGGVLQLRGYEGRVYI